MIITPFFQEHLLNYAFRATPFPFPDDRYLSLWVTTPGGTEVADAAYERIVVTFDAWATTLDNTNDRLFAAADALYSFRYLAIGTAKTGGDILLYEDVGTKLVNVGVQVRVKAGQIKLSVT